MKANALLIIPLLLFMCLVDWYTFRGIKPLIRKIKRHTIAKAISFFYWLISILTFLAFLLFFTGIKSITDAKVYVYVEYFIGWFALFYIPKFVFILFVLLQDILNIFMYLFRKKAAPSPSRRNFLYQLGLITAAVPFGSILYGVTKGKFDYRVIKERIAFPDLPKAFNGLRIVQISDIHLGSFNNNYEQVSHAITVINRQNPDIILFTGDLVNNFADETNGWEPVLSQMKARLGKYSILGNHDYGDYSHWSSPKAKAENLQRIKNFHNQIGFRLLLNETKYLTIGSDRIALIGVENWGRPPFPQYGDLNKAMRNTLLSDFKLLMSHDPTHWDAQVIDKTNINITFSGHTHGMQFGIERSGIKWSPVQYKYPRWGGLYKHKKQYLYVNRGFGYIGFPGRIGMPPEITLIELRKS